jgi:endonuclease/exonuclease/phosphatase (EEP) superfamily protein YafD
VKFESFSLRKAMLFLVTLCAMPTVVALLAGFLNPWFALADSLSHFRLHAVAALMLAAAAYSVFGAWRLMVTAIAAAALGLFGAVPALPFWPQDADVNGTKLKVLQFNTYLHNRTPEKSAAWIAGNAPDVVMLQEVTEANTVRIRDALAALLPAHATCKFSGPFSVTVMSRHRKLQEGCVTGEGLVWVQIDVGGKPVTAASIHTHWPYPFGQWAQVDKLTADLAKLPQPVILAGDFNAAPWSETVRRVARASGTELVPGLRLTLRMARVPMLPIDHILVSPGLSATDVRVGPVIGSDHLPVVAEIGLP